MTTVVNPFLKKRKKKPLEYWPQALTVVAGVLLVLGAAWWYRSIAPKPDGDPVAVARYIASDRFAALDKAEQKPYREAMMNTLRTNREALDGLDDGERRAAGRAAFRGGMQDRVDGYFALKTQAERDKFMKDMSAGWGGRRGGQGGPGGGNGQGRPGGGGQNGGRPNGGGPGGGGPGGGEGGGGSPGGGGGGGNRGNAEPGGNRRDPVAKAKMAEFVAQMRRSREAGGK